jgi:uncharacterized protein
MTMLAWERDDEWAGHSAARWEAVDDGWLFHGTEVLVGDEVLTCSFEVRLDPAWRTLGVEARSVSAAGQRSLSLAADRQRRWTVDGVRRADLDGCVDVDVAATPLTNTFPIRRLADQPAGVPTTSPVAWVEVPSLFVTRVEQTYERLPDRDGLAAWRYSDPTHGAFELTVDGEGLVVVYEGFARRVTG